MTWHPRAGGLSAPAARQGSGQPGGPSQAPARIRVLLLGTNNLVFAPGVSPPRRCERAASLGSHPLALRSPELPEERLQGHFLTRVRSWEGDAVTDTRLLLERGLKVIVASSACGLPRSDELWLSLALMRLHKAAGGQHLVSNGLDEQDMAPCSTLSSLSVCFSARQPGWLWGTACHAVG